MSSQYAGWKLATDGFFAMGSGPMRAKARSEDLFQHVPGDMADCAVGILETAQPIPDEIIERIARQSEVTPDRVMLMVARTASLAGSIQVVARSVETTLHKLFDLGFDLSRVSSGIGVAPLPPVAKDDLAGIGRTNDAILYGARVTLFVTGNDDELASIVEQIPSSASHDFGRPFGEIFAHYNYDFYLIDPHLFSPAQVTLMNVETGRSFSAGQVRPDLLKESFRQ